MSNILFLKQSILEDLESSKKGTISSDQILSLNNGLKYKLEAAIMIQTELSQNPDGKKYEGRIVTLEEINQKQCDLYMQTIIIDDFAFNVIEGFRATLIKEKKRNLEAEKVAEEKIKVEKMKEALRKEKELFEQQKKEQKKEQQRNKQQKEIEAAFKDEVTEIDYTKSEKDEVSDFILRF